MYIQFNFITYLQIEGLPSILAILFMDKLECKSLTSCQPWIESYKHYVDDISVQTTDEVQADDFHTAINRVQTYLKFEIEKQVTTPTGNYPYSNSQSPSMMTAK